MKSPRCARSRCGRFNITLRLNLGSVRFFKPLAVARPLFGSITSRSSCGGNSRLVKSSPLRNSMHCASLSESGAGRCTLNMHIWFCNQRGLPLVQNFRMASSCLTGRPGFPAKLETMGASARGAWAMLADSFDDRPERTTGELTCWV